MFDIGFWELLVIGTMALVILGPERLPGAIRSVVSTVRSVKQMANGFKEEVAAQLDAHELHTNLKKAEELGMQNIGKELRESVDELKAAAESVRQPYKAGQEHQDFAPKKVTDETNPANALIDDDEIDTFDDEYSHAHGHSSQPVSDTTYTEHSVEKNAPFESDKKQNLSDDSEPVTSNTTAAQKSSSHEPAAPEYNIQPDLLDTPADEAPEPVLKTKVSNKRQENNDNE